MQNTQLNYGSFGLLYADDIHQWLRNGNPIANATSNVYIAFQSGDYTVEVTDSNGCNATSTAVSVVTGLNTLMRESEARIFPNPNNGEFTLSIESATTQKVNANVFNSIGQLILKKEIETNTQTQFNLSANAKGIYYLQLQSERTNYNVKVSVE